MTKQEAVELDRQLAARGWRCDAGDGEFRSGTGRLDWEDVIGLIPDLSLDDLAAYEDDKQDQCFGRRSHD